jgi:dihydroorotase
MKPLLIEKGRLLDPGHGIDHTGSVLISDGTIVWLGQGTATPQATECDVLDASGLVVCPGFIDLHCHLREPGFEDKETIASGTAAAARGGFTTICCMPNTNPALDTPAVVEYVLKKAVAAGVVRVAPIACVTKGRRGAELADMDALSRAGAVGFSDDGDPVRGADIMRLALVEGKRLGLPVIDHCEDSAGGPPEGEVRMVDRDLSLAAETGGWVHIAHVSVAEAVGLIQGARDKGVRVTAEATPHHLTLTSAEIAVHGSLAKVNPPLRSERDRLALVHGLKAGVIDVIATDHAPHTMADKATDFARAASGISSFETAFGSLMQLVTAGHVTLTDLVLRLTAKPAAMLGGRLGLLGSLQVGSVADVCILDPNRAWTVDPDKFASKGRNTPIAGRVLKGEIVATIVGGAVVYQGRAGVLQSREAAAMTTDTVQGSRAR